jgi:predicted Zn-dependent protease
MPILSEQDAKKIIDKVLSYSKADETTVILTGRRTGNIRYARNTVSTSGETDNLSLSVTAVVGKRTGTATINEFDDASLTKTVERATEIARLAPENPEYLPALGPQDYIKTNSYSSKTAAIDPVFRANAAFESIQSCLKKDLTGAGYLEDNTSFIAMGNNKGMFGYNKETGIDFSISVRTTDGKGSGYGIQTVTDAAKLDTRTATAIAIGKAESSRDAIEMAPGKYTVILETTAAGELLQLMINSLDARNADEGRSYFGKKGGGNKIGEKLFNDKVYIYSDPSHPEYSGNPFANDGRPHRKVVWIENGVLKNLPYSRYWATQKGVEAIPSPAGVIMNGTDQSVNDLIKGTEKGILVTRFWYIRPVDPQTLVFTGLTRDGTFYIENGSIKYAIKNFRFNESPAKMLNNLEAIGKPVRVGNNLIPPMKIRDFNFTSLSDAV